MTREEIKQAAKRKYTYSRDHRHGFIEGAEWMQRQIIGRSIPVASMPVIEPGTQDSQLQAENARLREALGELITRLSGSAISAHARIHIIECKKLLEQ